jgi:hypothetical protein
MTCLEDCTTVSTISGTTSTSPSFTLADTRTLSSPLLLLLLLLFSAFFENFEAAVFFLPIMRYMHDKD